VDDGVFLLLKVVRKLYGKPRVGIDDSSTLEKLYAQAADDRLKTPEVCGPQV
jgi:hypothetical protein